MTVIALVLDSRCRLLHNARGVMKIPYSTKDVFDTLFSQGERRRIREAGMVPMLLAEKSERRMLVFGIVPDTVTANSREH